MTSMMSNYSPESEEYKTLYYRVQCGQAQQQSEIDRAKGIISNPMPKGWYDQSANKIQDGDSPEEIARKRKYQKLCANKKPYFFIYNYDTEMQAYKAYREKYETEAPMYWGMSLSELLKLESKTKEQQNFVKSYVNNAPVDMSDSTMNKICFTVEDFIDDFKVTPRQTFDYSVLKSGRQYNALTRYQIEQLYQKYKASIKSVVLECNDETPQEEPPEYIDYKDSVIDWFADQCHAICPDDIMLCDILIDICYAGRNHKEVVWEVCGDTIVENLLRHHNRELSYPKRVSTDGEFGCMGEQFVMETIRMEVEDDA